MRQKASDLGVDLLLIDTGDLHDSNGLSDASDPSGHYSNEIFSKVDYDLLTIGNHEFYNDNVTRNVHDRFGLHFDDRYLTTNVEMDERETGDWKPIGKKYRYFQTRNGLRIMAFGVLFDYAGKSTLSRVTKAAYVVNQAWFEEVVTQKEHIDLFVVIGHNPVRSNDSESTITTYYQAIRKMRPDVPIQIFGGHRHRRDFVVYDSKTTGLASGRYCETLGWLSMTGLNSSTYKAKIPTGVPIPNRSATPASRLPSSVSNLPFKSSYLYARRYLDWNRLTFEYHGKGSQSREYRTDQGTQLSDAISYTRKVLHLNKVYDARLEHAMATVVVNRSRSTVPRMIIYNGGNVRFDLVQGPFTYDDLFIVSPFKNNFRFIPDVPYESASKILSLLNSSGSALKHKRSIHAADPQSPVFREDDCSHADSSGHSHSAHKLHRRMAISPGYTTTDDFGNDGDDTLHSPIPTHLPPNALQINASFPVNGSNPRTVDLVFVSFIESAILQALKIVGSTYTAADVNLYMPANFTTNTYLGEYAKLKWQANIHNCSLGNGVGS